MESNSINIKFIFPEFSQELEQKESFVENIIKKMKKDKIIRYSGYADNNKLFQDLLGYIGDNIDQYRKISSSEKDIIQKRVLSSIKKCEEKVTIPTKLFFFIFPWLPSKKKSKVFGGVMGSTPYISVIYLFISLESFIKKSLIHTVVHELNHSLFYYYHPSKVNKLNLLDNIVIEGFAENFREEIVKGEPAPWSIALKKKEAFYVLDSLGPLFNSLNKDIHEKILFGGDEYKKWTGYSIGYWLVKEVFKRNPSLGWDKALKEDSTFFLKEYKKRV